jgi:transcriptional regulator GlxA family with amidase domain
VQTAIQKIETQSPSVHSFAFLTRETGMNINAFIRLFRERTSFTPAMYPREPRIEVACVLLHLCANRIEEIGSTCGYAKNRSSADSVPGETLIKKGTTERFGNVGRSKLESRIS